MQNDKLISVIVPVYNAEKYLEKCISSLINQTYPHIEIIIINDGSTDKSSEILSRYEVYHNIKIFHQENKGVSATRNIALKKCTGNFITFVDADDFVDVSYCQQLYENLVENNADISICNYYRVENQNNIKINGINKEFTTIQALTSIFEGKEEITGFLHSKLYKKNCFNNILFPEDKNSFEDYSVIYKIIAKSNKIIIFDAPLYYYVFNENSITSQMDAKKSYDFIEVIHQMYLFAENYKEKLPNWKFFISKTAFQYQFALKRYFIHKDKEENYEFTRKISKIISEFYKKEQISVKYWKLLLFIHLPKLYYYYIILKK